MVYFVLFAAPNVLMPVLKVTLNPYLTFKNLAANYSNALMHNLQSLHTLIVRPPQDGTSRDETVLVLADIVFQKNGTSCRGLLIIPITVLISRAHFAYACLSIVKSNTSI